MAPAATIETVVVPMAKPYTKADGEYKELAPVSLAETELTGTADGKFEAAKVRAAPVFPTAPT